MLRSIDRHFNDIVFRGPDNEGGGGDAPLDSGGADDTGLVDDGSPADGGEEVGEPDKPLTVREQLKKSIAEASADATKPAEKTAKTGARKPREAPPVEGAEPPKEPVAGAVPAPEALSKEAKAEWDKTPAAVQQAFVKREQDIAAGVAQLRQRYSLIDQAIEPHTDALRQMNATPGEAVNRMFLWFKALAGRPTESFPALAKSMGVDWASLVNPQAPQQPGQVNGTAPEIPEPVRQYVGQLENQLQQVMQQLGQVSGRFGNVEQTINSQNEARTRENLSLWSNGKPHFEEVRIDMAKLIETGMVPLKADGQVDLDTAYERAIYFNPEVRAKVLAEQQQANQQVQQESKQAATTAAQTQVTRARKASVSLPASSTPSTPGAPLVKQKPGQKLSVRDSLKAAVAELRDQ